MERVKCQQLHRFHLILARGYTDCPDDCPEGTRTCRRLRGILTDLTHFSANQSHDVVAVGVLFKARESVDGEPEMLMMLLLVLGLKHMGNRLEDDLGKAPVDRAHAVKRTESANVSRHILSLTRLCSVSLTLTNPAFGVLMMCKSAASHN